MQCELGASVGGVRTQFEFNKASAASDSGKDAMSLLFFCWGDTANLQNTEI